ncbi:hypothetical protein Tco_0878021 [Tanacetum coccineum]|uniref:Uncharacterized protein n=1 Tax=Tanacetum coccineum TaxID=301880 RepID=A0ABQ5BWR7_9ASTR
MVAFLKKPQGSEDFQQIVDFLNTSHISTKTLDNGEIELTATVDGQVKTITKASVRRHLKLADADGISTLPSTEIFKQLSLIGNMKRETRGFSEMETALFPTMLVNEQSSQGEGPTSPVGTQPTPTLIVTSPQLQNIPNTYRKTRTRTRRMGIRIPRSNVPTSVVDEAVTKEMHDRLERPTTTAFSLEAVQGSGIIHKSQSNTTPSGQVLQELAQKVVSGTTLPWGIVLFRLGLEDELKRTKDVYNKALITLTKRVKKLEKKLKSKSRRAVVVSSKDEEASLNAEDSPKQGRMIEEIDQDENVNLIKGRARWAWMSGPNSLVEYWCDEFVARGEVVIVLGGASGGWVLVGSECGGWGERGLGGEVVFARARLWDSYCGDQSLQYTYSSINHETPFLENPRKTHLKTSLSRTVDYLLESMNITTEFYSFSVSEAVNWQTSAFSLTPSPLCASDPKANRDPGFQRIGLGERKKEVLVPQERKSLYIKERSRLLAELIDQRKKLQAAQRAKAIRNKPPTKSQRRKYMTTFLKNQADWKAKQFKESAKKQNIEDEKESDELKKCLEVVPDDGDDVFVDVTPLASKPPTIIDYKIFKQGKKEYFQIFRFKKTQPKEVLDIFLFHILKTMFEYHIEDNVWKHQQRPQGLAKVKNWKLFDSCGVHYVTL